MKMIKRVFQFFCLFLFLIAAIYLLMPSPNEPPPLPNSIKSTEPGDTVEIPGLFAYYTNMSRSDVLSFYQNNFTHSRLFNFPLITYRLNHPPEDTWTVIRDTVHSSYLEELVHPLRESWYINGYEPVNDPFTKGTKFGNFNFNGQEYTAKITVLKKESNPVFRVTIFTFIVVC
ncbi:MAG: hypothetical protein U1E54_04820, partial [Candidatus Levybacteria bacterium]|nr:hypothetical protein [Candidatus Levybacteria bacterium]